MSNWESELALKALRLVKLHCGMPVVTQMALCNHHHLREYQLYENTGDIYSDDESDHDSDDESDDNSNDGRDYPESDDDSDTEVLEITLSDGTAVPFIDPEGEGEGERASTEDPGKDAGATAELCTKCNKKFECTELQHCSSDLCTISLCDGCAADAWTNCRRLIAKEPGDYGLRLRYCPVCEYEDYMQERDRGHFRHGMGHIFCRIGAGVGCHVLERTAPVMSVRKVYVAENVLGLTGGELIKSQCTAVKNAAKSLPRVIADVSQELLDKAAHEFISLEYAGPNIYSRPRQDVQLYVPSDDNRAKARKQLLGEMLILKMIDIIRKLRARCLQAALSTWRTRAASAPTAKRKLGAGEYQAPNPKRQAIAA